MPKTKTGDGDAVLRKAEGEIGAAKVQKLPELLTAYDRASELYQLYPAAVRPCPDRNLPARIGKPCLRIRFVDHITEVRYGEAFVADVLGESLLPLAVDRNKIRQRNRENRLAILGLSAR